VVEANLKFIQNLRRCPSPVQEETLMRVFEYHYRRALKRGDKPVADRAIENARHWLNACGVSTPAIGLRKLLGIGLSARFADLRPTRGNSREE
jgi:hypothetical protein